MGYKTFVNCKTIFGLLGYLSVISMGETINFKIRSKIRDILRAMKKTIFW